MDLHPVQLEASSQFPLRDIWIVYGSILQVSLWLQSRRWIIISIFPSPPHGFHMFSSLTSCPGPRTGFCWTISRNSSTLFLAWERSASCSSAKPRQGWRIRRWGSPSATRLLSLLTATPAFAMLQKCGILLCRQLLTKKWLTGPRQACKADCVDPSKPVQIVFVCP